MSNAAAETTAPGAKNAGAKKPGAKKRSRRWATALSAAVASLLLLAAGAARADSSPSVVDFRTSKGVELRLPPISTLDCGQMRDLLRRIDRTGYRGPNPRPANIADQPLFEYENALAAAHFETCTRPSRASGARSGAFGFSGSN